MKHFRTGLSLLVLVAGLSGAPAWARSSVMMRWAGLGSTIVVSNLPRSSYEDLVTFLKPKDLKWVDVSTPKADVPALADKLVFILFLIRQSPAGVKLHPSWEPYLPVSAADFAEPRSMMILAKQFKIPDQDPDLYSMLIKAPDDRLMGVAVQECLGMVRDFPTGKPIVHEVVDLARIKSIACLPSVAQHLTNTGNAAEAALYKALVDLRVLRVVGREAMPVASMPSLMTLADFRRLGQDLGVQALAFVELTGAETICTESIMYKKASKKRVSDDRRKSYDKDKADTEAAGRKWDKKEPDADQVWAAKYKTRHFKTTVTGDIKILDAASGQPLLTYRIEGHVEADEEDDVHDRDYRWEKIDDIDGWHSDRERNFSVRLRTADATEAARQEVVGFGQFLATRAMLIVPGEQLASEQATPPAPSPAAKVLSIEDAGIFISLGREQGLQEGDTLTLWLDKELKDPDTGNVVEKIQTKAGQIKVVELFGKTSRCEVVTESAQRRLEVGDVLVPDKRQPNQ